jgi:hypothetical protein
MWTHGARAQSDKVDAAFRENCAAKQKAGARIWFRRTLPEHVMRGVAGFLALIAALTIADRHP